MYIGGWPLYADPNSMSFYPLRYLFPATREAFDYFSLAAAGIFALGNGWLAWELTRSRRSVLLAIVAAPGLGFLLPISAIPRCCTPPPMPPSWCSPASGCPSADRTGRCGWLCSGSPRLCRCWRAIPR
ncbi:hypothetical protein [Lysobacter gummosus]|uniref:hypothetical protein n=1 Tax=Lysobacter gummosus TaxID=262324 RepID=UPI003625303E